MKLRKFISLLLLTVYALATAGAAVSSLTCRCEALQSHAAQHICCSHCQLPSHVQPVDGEFRVHCCHLSHSTEIDLYTSLSSSDGNARDLKCVVATLPPSMAAECPCPAHVPALRRPAVAGPDPAPLEGVHRAVGLRAPPAMV